MERNSLDETLSCFRPVARGTPERPSMLNVEQVQYKITLAKGLLFYF
jgi:hypothetical protein